MGGQLQGYLIFVEVVFYIGSEAYEHGEFAGTEVGDIIDKTLGVYPHLQALVVAQVLLCIAVYTTCVAGFETGDLKRQRLLVELRDL